MATDDPGFEQAEARATLDAGLAGLPARERVILHLRFEEGLTQSQIAEKIGISQMHVSRLIRRAIESLRDDTVGDGDRGRLREPAGFTVARAGNADGVGRQGSAEARPVTRPGRPG